MFGGFSLLRLINRSNVLSPFQVNCFRAGHAHAGVLLVMSLLYYRFLEQTRLSVLSKHLASTAFFLGILAQSGEFFLHMFLGQENRPSAGTRVIITGAGLLTCSVVVLVYGLLQMGQAWGEALGKESMAEVLAEHPDLAKAYEAASSQVK